MRFLVIGYGHRVKDELSQIDRTSFDFVVGVNQAAIDFGPVDVHVTLHPEKYASVKAAPMVAPIATKGVDVVFPWQWFDTKSSGSSGLYAVKWSLQYSQDITLAGVGLDGPHYGRDKDWKSAERFQEIWKKAEPHLRGKVRSLGGWTKELLEV